jgi:hypothetical protein
VPAPPLSNSFEGGSDGTVLTTANTGGASGDAASSITDPNSIQKFNAANALHGGMCMTIVQTATPASTRWDWTGLGTITNTDVWFRSYLKIGTTIGQAVFMGVRTNAAALAAEFFVDATGHIAVNTGGGTNIAVLLGTTVISADQWIRLEARVRANGVGASHVEWWLYTTADSTSVTETKVSTVENAGTDVGQVRWGQVTNTTANRITYHEDVAVSTAGALGPSSAPVTPAMQPRRMPLGV